MEVKIVSPKVSTNENLFEQLILSRVAFLDFVEPSEVPDRPIAKVCYYIHCINTCIPSIQLDLGSDTRKLTEFSDWKAYKRYDSFESRTHLLEVLNCLNPKGFLSKRVFNETTYELIRSSQIKFVSLKSVQNLVSQSEELPNYIYVKGQEYDVVNLAFFNCDWLKEFYHKPIEILTQENMKLSSLLGFDLSPRKEIPTVLNTTGDSSKLSDDSRDRVPERDSKLWYIFLSIMSIIILTFMSVSNLSEGLIVSTRTTVTELTLWRYCVRSVGAGPATVCDSYSSLSQFGIESEKILNHLTASRVLVAMYPAVGLLLVLVSFLRIWSRKSATNVGRVLRAMMALLHFGYLVVTTSILTRYFNQVEDELLDANNANSDYRTSNGLGLLLPWAAWVLSIFHTLVCLGWAIRFWVKREVAPA